MPWSRRWLIADILAVTVLAAATAWAWAGWMAWGQDPLEDYAPWRIAGLVSTLLILVVTASKLGWSRQVAAVVPICLAAAAWSDWDDDVTGLFAVGVLMVFAGAQLSVSAVAATVSRTVRSKRRRGPA